MKWRCSVQLRLQTRDLDIEMHGDQGAVALVGPNGSGKTTLLRTIAGAHRPKRGYIEVGDHLLYDSERQLDLPPELRRVGYVPQGCGLFPHLRVVDNVAFGAPRNQRAMTQTDRRATASRLLQQMDCAHLAMRWPSTLSGGEQQRVALARSLMVEPQILLLDEPLSALDATARRSLRAYLAGHLTRTQTPAIVVTHDVRDVLALNARAFVLQDGAIVQSGSVTELAANPATEFVAEFVHAPLAQSPQLTSQ